MDTVFEVFPKNIRETIFDYLRRDKEILAVRRKLRPRVIGVGPYNMAFFRSWSYLNETMEPGQMFKWFSRDRDGTRHGHTHGL